MQQNTTVQDFPGKESRDVSRQQTPRSRAVPKGPISFM